MISTVHNCKQCRLSSQPQALKHTGLQQHFICLDKRLTVDWLWLHGQPSLTALPIHTVVTCDSGSFCFPCRLASFICGYEVFQIAVSSSYGVADFKENLLALYTKVSFSAESPHMVSSALTIASWPAAPYTVWQQLSYNFCWWATAAKVRVGTCHQKVFLAASLIC